MLSSEKTSSRIESCSQSILIDKDRTHKLTIVNGKPIVTEIHELYSNQEETDPKIIMYLHYTAKQGFQSAVIRSPDSDIYFIMLYYAHDINLTVYHDMGFGKHRKLIDVSAVACSLRKGYCDALWGFIFSLVYSNSAYKDNGKVGPLKL